MVKRALFGFVRRLRALFGGSKPRFRDFTLPPALEAAAPVEVTAATAARILNLPCYAVERMCADGTLRARQTGDRGWWRIEYESVLDHQAVLDAHMKRATAISRRRAGGRKRR